MPHTPGPWKVLHGCLPGDSGFSVGSNNAEAVNVKVTAECWPCTIVSEEHRQELFSNAKLIAASPDMLFALKQAYRSALTDSDGESIAHEEACYCTNTGNGPESILICLPCRLREVIAKATE